MNQRVKKLQGQLKKLKCSALLVSDPYNIRYLCGFTGTNGMLLVTLKDAILITDARYFATAKKAGVKYYDQTKGLKGLMEKYKSMGLEEQHMTVAKLASLKKILPKAKWKAMSGVVEGLRIIKDAGEIKIIKKAVQIAVKTLADFSKTIQVGQSEADMEWNLLSLARKNGADGFSFPPIITFGKNTSDIHAQRGNAKLKKGEVVLIDSGIIYQGYITDMTRMFYLEKGKGIGKGKGIEQKMYSIVLAANQAGIKAIKVGAKFSDIDKAARKVIEDAGYGKYFSHSTGHGTGLEVHEAPTVSVHSKDKVEKGMVFTVEPGVYIDGIGGVRIEDMVYVNEKGGVEVLTDYPKIMK